MTPITPELLMTEADRLFAYALKRVGDRQQAEDLVQDVLVAAWEKRENFEGRSKLGTWLVGIMRFKILDHYRSKRRTPTDMRAEPADREDWGNDPLDSLFDGKGAWKSDPNFGMKSVSNTPADDADRSDILRYIQECMGGLPERLRLLFSMREIDQLSVTEAAVAAGVTSGSAAVLLTRARHQMRACLQNHHIEPS